MSAIKNALLRYRIIDKAIRNVHNPYPSKAFLREACEEAIYGSVDGENICDSTIEKDMFAMRMEHDAPIKYSKKFGGYFYTDPEFSLDDMPLNEVDLEAIRFAANTLSQFKEVSFFKQFSFAIDKIADRLAVSESNTENNDQYIQFETPVTFGGSEFLQPLLTSIKNKTIVYFEYESFQSQKKKARKVLPLFLKEYRNRWYLLSHDCVKEQIITYALDRMSNLEQSDEKTSASINFKPSYFFQHAMGITASAGAPEKIVFKADNVAAKYIISQPFHSSMKVVKEGKNKTTFEMMVYLSEELIRELLSYGGDIEVLEPELLRDHMIRRIKAMVENYI